MRPHVQRPFSLRDPLDIPAPTPGRLDFYRIHAYALDRLEDVLAWFLPVGQETPDVHWAGHHPLRPVKVRVNLLTGAWAEPDTGRSGQDLVSLVAHLFDMKQCSAAIWMGAARQSG